MYFALKHKISMLIKMPVSMKPIKDLGFGFLLYCGSLLSQLHHSLHVSVCYIIVRKYFPFPKICLVVFLHVRYLFTHKILFQPIYYNQFKVFEPHSPQILYPIKLALCVLNVFLPFLCECVHLGICICICVYECGSVSIMAHLHGGQRITLDDSLYLPPCLRQGLHCLSSACFRLAGP